MTHEDRRNFRENLQAARAAVWSARVYAREGRVNDAMNCLRIGGTHRRIAKGYLPRRDT